MENLIHILKIIGFIFLWFIGLWIWGCVRSGEFLDPFERTSRKKRRY